MYILKFLKMKYFDILLLPFIYFSPLFCLFVACSYSSPLESALRSSGFNRPHLEQVLKHYSLHPEDSLKYKAACFLIENMPGHGWYEGDALEKYKQWIDSVYGNKDFIFKSVLYEYFFQQADAVEGLTWYEDIEYLDSNFLITYLDSTFDRLEKRPWLEAYTFEQLCEYILPYRVGYEPPMFLFGLQDSLFQAEVADWLVYDDAKNDASLIYNRHSPYEYQTDRYVKLCYRGREIVCDMFGCVARAIFAKWKGKLLLCPVAIDLLPAYSNRNARHCWWVNLDNSRANSMGKILFDSDKRGKVYRRTFSRHPRPSLDSNNYVPPFFRISFYKDVTSYYSRVKDVLIHPIVPVPSSAGYLCVFNNLEWKPVAYTPLDNGRFYFKDVGCGVVYLPVVYSDENALPVSYPFVLDLNGRIHSLQPDTAQLLTLKLVRKYPLSHTIEKSNRFFPDFMVEASNEPDFKNKDSVGVFGEISVRQSVVAAIRSTREYRYWRIRSADHFVLGECMLYDRDGRKVSARLQDKGRRMPYWAAFDDNPVSYAFCDANE